MNDEESAAMETAKQLGIPYASFANRILTMQKGQGLTAMVPKDIALNDLVFPLFIDGSVLAVAMANPADQALIERLRQASGLEIQPFIAVRQELIRAVEESYA
ncbi:MAG: hypothetical protein HYX59_13870 [Elusimicrobia bacterium]|nr:hypothetical protein [Elusimicrobiota bacterium]